MADRVVIIGGGPGGYEAAHVAAQLGAEVTVVDTDGIGGSAVLTDCVPSKTLIATAELMTEVVGRRPSSASTSPTTRATPRPRSGSTSPRSTPASSSWPPTSPPTSRARLDRDGVRVVRGRRPPRARPSSSRCSAARGALRGRRHPDRHRCRAAHAAERAARRRAHPHLGAGLRPRPRCRTKLIVVGSGVTGAEFASAYLALGIPVTLVSSRDRVLPGEDADAARRARGGRRSDAAWRCSAGPGWSR